MDSPAEDSLPEHQVAGTHLEKILAPVGGCLEGGIPDRFLQLILAGSLHQEDKEQVWTSQDLLKATSGRNHGLKPFSQSSIGVL